MTNIIYTPKKADDLTHILVIAIFSYLFQERVIKTLSRAIWNKAGVDSRDCHVTWLILKVIP
jgi:hypothetical protein